MRHTGAATAHRTTAVIVGVLFLSSTITFAVGNAMLRAALQGDAVNSTALLIGVAAQAYTAVAVAGIGWAMLPILRPYRPRAAIGYLVLRSLECLTILALGGSMLINQRLIDQYQLPIYAVSGAAGVALCAALIRTTLAPLTITRIGMIGYPVLVLGTLAALLHLADLDTPAGMVFFLPGAVFEIALPVRLLAKGFGTQLDDNPQPAARLPQSVGLPSSDTSGSR